jgi:TatD DNase family protein
MEQDSRKTTPHFFDAHTHIQFPVYDSDRAAVLARARVADIWMINVGTELQTSRKAIELAEGYSEGVYAAVGLHPTHTSASFHDEQELAAGDAAKTLTQYGEAFDIERYRRLALHTKTVAIGECGLDYFRFSDAESREEQIRKQKEAFIAQIDLAIDIKKPLMIHCRNAFADVIEILNFYKNKFDFPPGVIHFFTGTTEDAKQLLDLGFAFTFGGAITFSPKKGKTAGDYDEVIKLLPLEGILSETDAPYVTPVPHRGERNEPAYVIESVKKLAELKQVSAEEMKQAIFENAKRIFRI